MKCIICLNLEAEISEKKKPTQGYLKFGTFWKIHACFVSISGHFKGLDILTQLPCCPFRTDI